MRRLLTNVRAVSPGSHLPDAAVLIENGRIVAVGPWSEIPPAEGDDVIDLAGATVVPGFIDIHTHGANGSTTNRNRRCEADGILRSSSSFLFFDATVAVRVSGTESIPIPATMQMSTCTL